MANEVKGISFPFRIGGRGGVVLSGENFSEQLHIKESMTQLLGTTVGERHMKADIGLGDDLELFFEDLNETTKNMAIFKINEVVARYEPRVTVTYIDIVREENYPDKEVYVISVSYTINGTGVTDTVSVGF